jgi:hypothetical protein
MHANETSLRVDQTKSRDSCLFSRGDHAEVFVDANGYASANNIKCLLRESCHRVVKENAKKLAQYAEGYLSIFSY